MIVVFTKFPIKAEHFEEYKTYIKGAVDKHNIKEQKGFVDMRLLSPQNLPMVEDNSQFIIESIWEDIKSFTDYTQSEAFKKAHEDKPPHDWFADRPEVKVYETID
jgi:heme-degrading monooxygenase HmoA